MNTKLQKLHQADIENNSTIGMLQADIVAEKDLIAKLQEEIKQLGKEIQKKNQQIEKAHQTLEEQHV